MTDEQLVVHERPTLGFVVTVVAGLVFVAAGIAILLDAPTAQANRALSFAQVPLGLAGMALGAGAVWLGVRGRLRPRTLLRADRAGVTVDGYPTLAWSSVTGIAVRDVEYAGKRQLLLKIAPGTAVPTPRRGVVAVLLHLIGRALVWGPGWLPVRADAELPADDLADTLKRLRTGAGG